MRPLENAAEPCFQPFEGKQHHCFPLKRGYAIIRSRWDERRAFISATPRMGAKITATTPLKMEAGSLDVTTIQH